ncbi:MAG: hypothetical protein FWE26_05375 [Coriobacteriia bacterium]|nr:hypothetical protein [Coriobacteriia bacterium]MCL2871037.1 hypothetical protein [Coriobacteriia bacterium]
MEQSFTLITIEAPLEESAQTASECAKTRKELAEALGHQSRAVREYTSQVLTKLASADVTLLQDFANDVIDALNRPESLTRYSMIEIIGELAKSDSKIVTNAYEPLQDCLYDEESGTVRLYAFRVLARYGATGPARSVKVWPDLSMALRSFHGDPEFMAMMSELIAMLGGRSDVSVKESAVELFAFDAEHARGDLRKKAEIISSFAPEVLARINKANEEKARAATAAKEAAKAAAENEDEEEE